MIDTGLSGEVMALIQGALVKTPHLEKAVLFGSRARGDYKPESDIDIAIYGKNLTATDKSALYMRLQDLPVLYKIDLVHFDEIQDEQFRILIGRDQKVIVSA